MGIWSSSRKGKDACQKGPTHLLNFLDLATMVLVLILPALRFWDLASRSKRSILMERHHELTCSELCVACIFPLPCFLLNFVVRTSVVSRRALSWSWKPS